MGKHTSVWLVEPLTNLHVGNESVVNFSVIDKAIQRDAASGLPCINASSLKGAIKEFLTQIMEEKKVIEIFGSTKKNKNAETQKGSAVFFDANLLAIPEPETNSGRLYSLVTCQEVLVAFFNKAQALGFRLDDKMKKEFGKEDEKEYLWHKLMNEVKNRGEEGWEMDWNKNKERNRKDWEKFKALCEDDSLPIIARNCLENGESVNLWYEQVLPSKSLLGVVIQTQEAKDLDELDGKVVQVGANATIGYGYCKFTKL